MPITGNVTFPDNDETPQFQLEFPSYWQNQETAELVVFSSSRRGTVVVAGEVGLTINLVGKRINLNEAVYEDPKFLSVPLGFSYCSYTGQPIE